MQKIITGLAIFLSLSSIAAETQQTALLPIPNETLWKRIDQLNARIKKSKKPVSEQDFSSLLEEAALIVRSQEMDDDYSKLRSAAFVTHDFSVVDKLEKRASPAIFITYSGDWDRKEVSFETFKSLVDRGSSLDRYLDLYQKYSIYWVDLGMKGGLQCLTINFDFLLEGSGKRIYENKVPDLFEDLKKLRATLNATFLDFSIDIAFKCLKQ